MSKNKTGVFKMISDKLKIGDKVKKAKKVTTITKNVIGRLIKAAFLFGIAYVITLASIATGASILWAVLFGGGFVIGGANQLRHLVVDNFNFDKKAENGNTPFVEKIAINLQEMKKKKESKGKSNEKSKRGIFEMFSKKKKEETEEVSIAPIDWTAQLSSVTPSYVKQTTSPANDWNALAAASKAKNSIPRPAVEPVAETVEPVAETVEPVAEAVVPVMVTAVNYGNIARSCSGARLNRLTGGNLYVSEFGGVQTNSSESVQSQPRMGR